MAVSDKRPPDRDRDAEIIGDAATTRQISPVLIGLVVTVLVLLALIFFVGRDNSGSSDDRLSDNLATPAPEGSAEALCASKSTYDLIKRALFRQAAQVRGSDQAAYDRLAEYAFVRMEAPVLTGEDKDRGAAACAGSVTLELPPGLTVVGGRRTLSGELDYIVQPAADGSGAAVTLSHAESIVTPLATLTRTAGAAAPQPSGPQDANALNQLPPVSTEPRAAPQPVPDKPDDRPSFNCDNARTRSEIAVCGDSALAYFDRQMASQYSSALSSADSDERALLEQTRSRFLRFRDRCRTNQCIADAYQGRMREIRDIMSGNWQAPR
jgi:uncharacterized protein YecT (DUF1311 family)